MKKADKEQSERGQLGGKALYRKVGKKGMRALAKKRWAKVRRAKKSHAR